MNYNSMSSSSYVSLINLTKWLIWRDQGWKGDLSTDILKMEDDPRCQTVSFAMVDRALHPY